MTQKTPLIEQLVTYATNLTYEDISPQALQLAKWIVFDSIGTGLGGYQRALGQKAANFGANHFAGDQATLLGDGRKSTVAGAAFSNATMIKILGMDDSHRSASHIAAEVFPAALAVAETHQTSGRDFIVALVAAYDLAVRVGCAVRFEQRKRGLDVKGTVGAISAALAAGLCAKLDEETLCNAVALAADMSSGTEQYVYDPGPCDTKDLISGFAARSGVFATELAAYGFYGPQGGLDGEYGFFRVFGDGYDLTDFDDLGQHFAITTTAFKPHGGCRHTHQAVDAIQQIQAKVEFDPTEIDRVLVKTYQYALQPTFRVDVDPPSREVAGLSIRVAAAIALTYGSAWPEDFAHWDDPEIRRLRHATDIAVEPDIEAHYPDKNGCRVIVTMKDGQTHEGYVEYAKGEPEFRLTESELKAKFDALTAPILSSQVANEIYARSMALEEEEALSDLLKLTKAEEVEDAVGVLV
ncbi:MAG: MmgE/PrpD family protein [Chloroflexota bacterium]